MADLITKLLLNTQQFDQNLGKSSQQIQGFQQKINTFSSGAVGAFTKFAGVVGLAMSGMEAFDKAIKSNQTTADAWEINIGAAKDSVDVFFRSLVSGDWTPFQNGILTTFANLKEFQTLLDELDDKKLSLGYIKADDMRDIARFEEIAKDTTKSYEERIDAVQNLEGATNHLAKKTQETIDFQLKTLNQDYASRSGLKIDTSDLDYFFKNTNFSGELTSNASAAYKEYVRLNNEAEKLKKNAEYDATTYGNDPSRKAQKEYQDKLKLANLYKQENDSLIKQGWLAEEGNEKRKKTVEILMQTKQQQEELYRQEIKNNKTRRTVTKGDTDDILLKSNKGSKITKASVATPLVGSIAYDKAELAELKKQYEYATNEGVRAGLRKAIDLAELKLKIKIDGSNIEEIKSKGFNPTGKSIKGDLASGAIKVKGVEDKKLINADPSDLDYLNSMSTLMTSIASATGQASDNWLSYTANVLAGIGQLLPQLFQVFGIKSKIAIADSAALPPPLNIIAMAATAAALASTIAGLPKFADGGIIGGSSFIGDNMIARVNSGEMILNGTQQRNLFNLLDGKGGSIGSSASVEFKISGKDLVGTLNNQMSKTNKYK